MIDGLITSFLNTFKSIFNIVWSENSWWLIESWSKYLIEETTSCSYWCRDKLWLNILLSYMLSSNVRTATSIRRLSSMGHFRWKKTFVVQLLNIVITVLPRRLFVSCSWFNKLGWLRALVVGYHFTRSIWWSHYEFLFDWSVLMFLWGLGSR